MEIRKALRVLARKPEGKRQLVDIDKDGRIVLHVFSNKMEISDLYSDKREINPEFRCKNF